MPRDVGQILKLLHSASLNIQRHFKNAFDPQIQAIPFSQISSHCARMTVVLGDRPTWVTIPLCNVSSGFPITAFAHLRFSGLIE